MKEDNNTRVFALGGLGKVGKNMYCVMHKDEIIIADLNCDGNLLNLGYICDSLSYNFLSYSDEIKDKLATFANYVINKYLFSL